MDVFERHFSLLRKSEKIFNTYYKDNTIGIPMPETYNEDILRKGKDFLTANQIEYFLQVRCMHYEDVVKNELGNLTYSDWLVCLKERVLLIYAVPLFSRILEKYPMLYGGNMVGIQVCSSCGLEKHPMLYGGNSEWQVLYEITIIDKKIWNEYPEWKTYFKKIICDFVFVGDVKSSINKEYLYQFEKFISE